MLVKLFNCQTETSFVLWDNGNTQIICQKPLPDGKRKVGWYTLGNRVSVFVVQLINTEIITKFVMEQYRPKFYFQISVGEENRKCTERKSGKNRKMINGLLRKLELAIPKYIIEIPINLEKFIYLYKMKRLSNKYLSI